VATRHSLNLPDIRPLKYLPPLQGEWLEMYQSMPKLGGMVISLFYVEPPHLAGYEQQWREWAAGRDRRYWPNWLERWAAERKRQVDRLADAA
jgi:hypothetical protein